MTRAPWMVRRAGSRAKAVTSCPSAIHRRVSNWPVAPKITTFIVGPVCSWMLGERSYRPCGDPGAVARVRPSPGDRLPVPEESPGRVAQAGRAEDDRSRTDLHAPRRAPATHVRAHPARADGVDADAPRREFARKDPGERVHGDLRHRIRTRPTGLAGIARLQISKV